MATLTDFARFLLWADQCETVPSMPDIVERYDVAPMTAYRWRKHYATASGKTVRAAAPRAQPYRRTAQP